MSSAHWYAICSPAALLNLELMREESAERQHVSHKLQLCPEEYLPIVEGAIDGALRIYEQEKEPVCV